MNNNQHWYILGAGAIGCLWAAYWSKEGRPVTLIGRQSLQHIHLTLNNSSTAYQTKTPYKTAETLQTPIHRLLITTKAQHTHIALTAIKHLLADDAIIMVLQNGMAACEITLTAEQQLVAATTTDGAYRQGPFHVVHAGLGETFYGSLNSTPLPSWLHDSLPKSLKTSPCEDMNSRLWQKLAINCAINGLTVKYQCCNGDLLHIPKACQEMSLLCDEIIQLCHALSLGPWFDHLESRVTDVLVGTAKNINSMLQDFRQGKSLEIDQLNGFLCRKAASLNITMPHHQKLIEHIAKLEREQGTHNEQDTSQDKPTDRSTRSIHPNVL